MTDAPLATESLPVTPLLPLAQGPRRSRWWHAVVVFGGYWAGMAGIGLAARGVLHLGGADVHIRRTLAVLLPVLTLTCLWGAVAAWLADRWLPAGERLRERVRPSPASVVGYFLIVIGGFCVAWACSALLVAVDLRPNHFVKNIEDFRTGMTGVKLVAALVVLGAFPGIAEELLFRGYLQASLRGWCGTWPAILITSALFGISHGSLAMAIWAGVLGVYLGYVAERVGSLRPGMLCHGTFNAFSVLMLTLAGPSLKATPEPAELTLPIRVGMLVFVAVLGVAGWGCVMYIRRTFPPLLPASRSEGFDAVVTGQEG